MAAISSSQTRSLTYIQGPVKNYDDMKKKNIPDILIAAQDSQASQKNINELINRIYHFHFLQKPKHVFQPSQVKTLILDCSFLIEKCDPESEQYKSAYNTLIHLAFITKIPAALKACNVLTCNGKINTWFVLRHLD